MSNIKFCYAYSIPEGRELYFANVSFGLSVILGHILNEKSYKREQDLVAKIEMCVFFSPKHA